MTIEDRVIIGGIVGVHQFSKIGRLAMLGAHSMITKDVPPYTLVDGNPAKAFGPNIVGLRRNGYSPEVRLEIQRALRILYRTGYSVSKAIEVMEQELAGCQEIDHFIRFLRSCDRGISSRAASTALRFVLEPARLILLALAYAGAKLILPLLFRGVRVLRKRIGMLAGYGDLPVAFAIEAQAAGIDVCAIGITADVNPQLKQYVAAYREISLGQWQQVIDTLRAYGVQDLVLLGSGKVLGSAYNGGRHFRQVVGALQARNDDRMILAL